MKLIKSILLLLLTFCILIKTSAQKNVYVESIQVYSNILPTAQYFRPDSSAIQLLMNGFDKGIAQKLNLSIEQSKQPKVIVLNRINQLGKINIDWSQTQQYANHAYIELYEMDPEFVFRNNLLDSISDSKKDSIKSIWFLTCTIVNQKKEILFKKTLLMQMIPTHHTGIGIPLIYPSTIPENIFKALAKGIEMINQHEELDLLNAKVPSCYAIDNFIMPYVYNEPRIKFDTLKNVIRYKNQNINEIIRIPNAITQKINTKDKSSNNPLASLLPIIKSKAEGSGELYQITQPLRDVKNNIDYHIESIVQINTLMNENFNPLIFIKDSSVHGLYENNKLVSYLKINDNVIEKDYWFNTNSIYNGIDSSVKYSVGTSFQKGKVLFEKVIEGNIEGVPFKILIHQVSSTKLIFYNKQLAIIIDGEKLPDQMVIVNKNISNKLINLFTLLSYSEIFQSHSTNE